MSHIVTQAAVCSGCMFSVALRHRMCVKKLNSGLILPEHLRLHACRVHYMSRETSDGICGLLATTPQSCLSPID